MSLRKKGGLGALNEKSWQVIHLSTGHEGGAGLAARRLNSALNQHGITSSFGALSSLNYIPGINEFSIPRRLWQRLLSGFLVRAQGLLTKKVLFSLRSLNVYKFQQIRHLGDPSNTVLHFHNWYNLVNQKEILNLSKKGYPVVLTLHDERFFTGGCHYAFECQKFKSGCSSCPELVSVMKSLPGRNISSIQNLLEESKSKLAFIAPSEWLKREALSSFLLRNNRVLFIPNTLGIPTDILEIENRTAPKAKSNLTIGIASMDKTSYIKGGDITSQIEAEIRGRNLQIRMIYLSEIADQASSKKEFWDQIDYLLVPSRAENSPNVIHEAKHSGIPVIASDIGGISELLFRDFDIAIPGSDISAQKILEILMSILSDKKKADVKAMQKSFLSYVGASVESHKNLYLSLLKK